MKPNVCPVQAHLQGWASQAFSGRPGLQIFPFFIFCFPYSATSACHSWEPSIGAFVRFSIWGFTKIPFSRTTRRYPLTSENPRISKVHIKPLNPKQLPAGRVGGGGLQRRRPVRGSRPRSGGTCSANPKPNTLTVSGLRLFAA